MRSLGSFSDSDGLSQLLLRLTVNSTVYCLSEMTAPWGFQVAARSGPAFLTELVIRESTAPV